MKKAFGYFVLMLCLLVYALSSDDQFTRMLTAFKNESRSVFCTDRYRYGDLYGMSYLPGFRKSGNELPIISPQCELDKKIDLYSICDSYLWAFIKSSEYYCGVNKLTYAKLNFRETLAIRLDSSKKNVLLVELSERNLKGILEDTAYVNRFLELPPAASLMDTTLFVKSIDENYLNTDGVVLFGLNARSYWNSVKAFLRDVVFNKNINTNIQSNIWDISIFTPIKEFRAAINYRLLGEVDKDVKVSKKSKNLFYTPTIDTAFSFTSSFRTIDYHEIDRLVASLNNIYNHAKDVGFQKVYLSIIPNPVSVIEPYYGGLTYNHMVNRIQSSPVLQMECINILPVFSKLKRKVYYESDSHWNMFGAQIWLNHINGELSRLIEEK